MIDGQDCPVGSVVRLSSVDILVMIIGFEPTLEGITADYLGVAYPMGLVSEDSAIAFDQSSIEEVLSTGYLDNEGAQAFASVRAYREASSDMAMRVEQLLKELTPERVQELRERYEPRELPSEFAIPEGYVNLTIE